MNSHLESFPERKLVYRNPHNYTIKEHGWPGHHICAPACLYRRNTHVTHPDGRVLIISSVGDMMTRDTKPPFGPEGPHQIGCDRCYETMIFHGMKKGLYMEINVKHECEVLGDWSIVKVDHKTIGTDNEMDIIHDENVSLVCENFERVWASGNRQ